MVLAGVEHVCCISMYVSACALFVGCVQLQHSCCIAGCSAVLCRTRAHCCLCTRL